MICVVMAAQSLVLAASAFSLSWTHSVEKTAWQEQWALNGPLLTLQTARIKSSGAGMEPGEDAWLIDGWWVWHPHAPSLEKLSLAASGDTVSAWTLCADRRCHTLGAKAGAPITISPCAVAQ